MALTTPFINTISAFDATKANNSIYLSVLGGDTITGYTYSIYKQPNYTTSVYSNTIAVNNDILTTDIRNFVMSIPANTLTNNAVYYIVAYTTNASGNSLNAQSTPFNCYATPYVSVTYSTDGGTVYSALSNGAEINSSSFDINISFNANAVNSVAKLNSVQVNLYGINGDGNQEILYNGEINYVSPFQQTIRGLSNTSGDNVLYSSYELVVNGMTIDGMAFNQVNTSSSGTTLGSSITGITCSYETQSADGSLTATNLCESGQIEIFFNGENSMYISNSPTFMYSTVLSGNNLYCGGGNGIAVFNTSTHTFGNKIISPMSPILSMVLYGTSIYCGGVGGFGIFNTSTQTFGNYDNSVNINTMLLSGNNLYCGSILNRFYIYNISTQAFGDAITSPMFNILSMVLSGNNLYCGGSDGIAIFNTSTQTFGSLITSAVGDIRSMVLSGNNLYCGGSNGIAVFNTSTQTFGSLVASPAGGINAMVLSGNNLYCGCDYGFSIYNISTQINTLKMGLQLPLYGLSLIEQSIYCAGVKGLAIYNLTTQSFGYPLTVTRYESGDTSTEITLGNYTFGAFTLYDNTAKNGIEYIYKVQEASNPITEYECSVLSQFNKTYICDANTIYDIMEEWTIVSQQRNQLTTTYSPIGSKYPFVGASALTSYDSGSMTAILRTSTSQNGLIDRKAQVQLVKQFNDWLINHQVKVIKDFNGNIYLVGVIDAVSNSYYKELGNGLASTTFNWVAIGDFTEEYIQKLGLFNNLNIIYQ